MRTNVFLLMMLGACGPEQTGGNGGVNEGTGVGTAASGIYLVETVSTSCSGTCAITVDGFTISVCDVGDRIDSTMEVRQDDGALQIDSEDSDYVSRMTGSIDADGRFAVRGSRTEQGGLVTITINATGVVSDPEGDATLDGSATGRVSGTVSGQTLSCNLAVDLEGARSGPLEP